MISLLLRVTRHVPTLKVLDFALGAIEAASFVVPPLVEHIARIMYSREY